MVTSAIVVFVVYWFLGSIVVGKLFIDALAQRIKLGKIERGLIFVALADLIALVLGDYQISHFLIWLLFAGVFILCIRNVIREIIKARKNKKG